MTIKYQIMKKIIISIYYFENYRFARFILRCLFSLIFLLITIFAESQYLIRSISSSPEISISITTPSAHYNPMFGAGDENSEIIKGITHFGHLTVDPGGRSNVVKFADEELVLYILDGTCILNYNKEKVPVNKNDFMYVPVGTKIGISNPRERSVSVIVMGFKVPPSSIKKSTTGLMIANSDEVPLQILGSHGPTTQFKLLLGTTESTRDKLAAATQVNSLFIMDFNAGGTNIPHRHDDEEEIYFILRGHGEIVAGESSDGRELRHLSNEGDAYFFSPKTLIGFYSGNKDGEEHARILAVRFKYPSQSKDKDGNKLK
jgi:mannose-6-phosphate isomerase-like protein (cupin superfamily)